jgi:hypothetical protein
MMVQWLTPEEVKVRAERAELESRLDKELALIGENVSALDVLATLKENSAKVIEKVAGLIELSKLAEKREQELVEMVKRLEEKLRG